MKGSLSPLLSLGVGFKPELSAEENVHLYGSILGIRDNNLSVDEIFDFAELQKFRKMKLKNFSSGMYIRLAFSTAVAVDPDILLIDEVLAVGDEEFQKKCMDKIYEFKRSRKTIIFVSHALDAIKGLCDRSILLDSGEIKFIGPTEKVINDYLSDIREKEEEKLIVEHQKLHDEVVVQTPEPKSIEEIVQEPEKPINRWGSREIEITEVKFLNKRGNETFIFKTGEMMIVRMKYNAKQRIEKPVFGIAIHRNDGTHITGPNTKVHNQVIDHVEGEGEIEYIIDSLPLLEGTYLFTAGVFDYMCVVPYDYHNMRFTFKVAKGDVKDYGIFYIPGRWRYR